MRVTYCHRSLCVKFDVINSKTLQSPPKFTVKQFPQSAISINATTKTKIMITQQKKSQQSSGEGRKMKKRQREKN